MIDTTMDEIGIVSELSLRDLYPSATNNKSVTLAHCIQMGDVWRLHDAYANSSIDTGLNYADAWSRVVSNSWPVWCVDPCYNPPTIFIITSTLKSR
jgi:hypothetical protein